MAQKIVTLYVDDDSLRLMVSQGKQIKEWAELPLEPGLVENTVVIKEAEVAAKIKQLFKTQNVTSKKVILGMSGLHCLSRPITLPQLPREMLEEAVKREAKRVLPVPLEQLYLSQRIIPSAEGKMQVYLAAIPCNTADALLKTLRQAGLRPYIMDIKPLLLARVVKEATAIIIDVQKREFDVVIMSDGVPQPVRSIALAEGALSWKEKLTTIRNELNRTIQFYNSSNPENQLDPSIPIFVSGELANEPEVCQALSDEIGHPVLLLPSPLECPVGFDPSRYMVNIGLTLQELPLGKEAGPSVANLNVLPIPYQPKPISLVNIFALPIAIIVAGLLVLLLFLVQSGATNIDSIRGDLNASSELLKQRQTQRNELNKSLAELQRQIDELEASRDNLAAALGSLETRGDGINRNLEATVNSIPATVSLSNISHANNILTISGRAQSEREVVLYLTNLENKGGFGDITSANMSKIAGGGTAFTLRGSSEKLSNGVSAIQAAINRLPTTLSLASAEYADGTLTMDGMAPGEDEVLSYLWDLHTSGKFSEIIITSMTRIEGAGMDFSLVLKAGE